MANDEKKCETPNVQSSFSLDLSASSFLFNWYTSFQEVTINTIPGTSVIIFSFCLDIQYIYMYVCMYTFHLDLLKKFETSVTWGQIKQEIIILYIKIGQLQNMEHDDTESHQIMEHDDTESHQIMEHDDYADLQQKYLALLAKCSICPHCKQQT